MVRVGGVVTPRVWGNDPYWMTHEAPRQSLMVAPPDVFLAPPPPPPPPPPVFFLRIIRSVRSDGRRTLGATAPHASLRRRRTDRSAKPRKRRCVLDEPDAGGAPLLGAAVS